MPYFDYSQYNYTAIPSGGNQNSITRTAKDFGLRDFLLQKNIGGTALPPTLLYNIVPKGIISPKIGEPFLDTSVNGNVNVVPKYFNIEQYGIIWKNTENINNNQFKNDTSNSDTLVDIIGNQPKEIGGIIDNGYSNFSFGKVYFPLAGVPLSYPMKPDSPLIDSYGILAKSTFAEFTMLSTLKNVYNVPEEQKDTSLGIDSQKVNEDFKASHKGVSPSQGYANQYGVLNQGGGAAMAAADVLGSVLNGQGVGITQGGISSNFDLRSSLVGRILGATGTINDTNLGKIGGNQLALALGNNAAFNVQQEILGKLNLQDNVLSLIKGNGLAGFRPNYQITVPSSGVGKFFNGAAKILGFTLPRSFISNEGSIFANESGNVENVKRANALLANTGKGQFVSLIKNVKASIDGTNDGDSTYDEELTPFRSGYAPSYAVGDKDSPIIGDNIYAYSDFNGHLINPLSYSKDNTGKSSVIPDLSFLNKSGFEGFQGEYPDGTRGNKIKRATKSWTSDSGGTVNQSSNNQSIFSLPIEKRNLLNKTQKLFNSSHMRTIISKKGILGEEVSQIQTTNAGGVSKGSAVLGNSLFNLEQGIYSGGTQGVDDVFARAWTTFGRYDKVSKLIRHRGLDEKVPYRHQMQGSVLDDNGFVKMSPYIDVVDDPKKFMFSIENLAWNDQYYNLLPCERGSGDLLTGKKGRIMWFPPYDIQFSESNSVEWESNKFIGRGESVYTYSNTERSGTLSFKVVVDHPTYVNSFSDRRTTVDDNYVASFFAGEIDPSESFSNTMTSYELNEQLKEYTPTDAKISQEFSKLPNDKLVYYFPNDVYTYYNEYENGSGLLADKYIAGQLTSKRTYNTGKDYSLNETFSFDGVDYSDLASLGSAIGDFLNKNGNEAIVLKITGFASIPGQNTANDALASKRADTIIDIFKPQMSIRNINKRLLKIPNTQESGGCDAGDEDQNAKQCKMARRVEIYFDIDYNLISDKKDFKVKKTARRTITKNPFYGECGFFEKLKQEDDFVFDKFRDKIKYFHPAFHSTTPEGLNARLTFLLQCTRQGPTLEEEGANNLAFGRPPVCILRIGDFYNTKIIIDNISFDYEPLVWDLNPEGIGVQPMIANVNMSFKFIGGSTLLGPINKLQNALSFNYFANTHVYDVRADYLAKVKNPKSSKSPSSDYELINAAMDTITGKDGKTLIKGDLNKGVSVEIIDTIIPEVDQVKSSDKATNGIEEQKPISEIYKINGFTATYGGKSSEADSKLYVSNFFIKVKWIVYNTADSSNVDVNVQRTILDELYKIEGNVDVTYKLSIKDINSSEIYEEIVSKDLFIAYTQGTIMNVPITNGKVPSKIGLKDSLGKETFEISLLKVTTITKEIIGKQNIKLK